MEKVYSLAMADLTSWIKLGMDRLSSPPNVRKAVAIFQTVPPEPFFPFPEEGPDLRAQALICAVIFGQHFQNVFYILIPDHLYGTSVFQYFNIPRVIHHGIEKPMKRDPLMVLGVETIETSFFTLNPTPILGAENPVCIDQSVVFGFLVPPFFNNQMVPTVTIIIS